MNLIRTSQLFLILMFNFLLGFVRITATKRKNEPSKSIIDKYKTFDNAIIEKYRESTSSNYIH